MCIRDSTSPAGHRACGNRPTVARSQRPGPEWLPFKTNVAFVIGLGLLLVTIATLVLGQARTSEGWIKTGGWLGLILALEIFYVAAAELINQMFGRHVLPLGDLSVGRKHKV